MCACVSLCEVWGEGVTWWGPWCAGVVPGSSAAAQPTSPATHGACPVALRSQSPAGGGGGVSQVPALPNLYVSGDRLQLQYRYTAPMKDIFHRGCILQAIAIVLKIMADT